MYGIFHKDSGVYHYYPGSTKHFANLEKIEIKGGNYAIFKLASVEQNDIVNFDEKINKQWINSTNYQIKDSIKIELYKDNYCYTYLPIKIS